MVVTKVALAGTVLAYIYIYIYDTDICRMPFSMLQAVGQLR